MKTRTKYSIIIYSVAIASLTLFNLTPALETFDTMHYLSAGEHLWQGRIDCLRTPIYPLLLHISSLPYGLTGCAIIMTTLQSAIYLLSVFCMNDMAHRLIKKEWVAFFVTLLYILSPAASWCNELLTESLSISLSVIVSQQLVAFFLRPSIKRSLGISLLLLVMVLLRPNFISLCLIVPCLWGYQWVTTRQRNYLFGILLMLIPIGGYLSYCNAYKQEYGTFSSSIATDTCKMYLLEWSGCWDTSCLLNENQKSFCRKKITCTGYKLHNRL